MRKTYRYRIYPTRKQQHTLNETLSECRWLYNHLLEMRKTTYEQEGKSLSLYQQQETYPLLKAERPSLKEVHSQVLQNVAVRIDLAMKAFFRRVKSGETPGFPRFRGADRYDSFSFPQSGFSITHDHRVCLSKIGSIKMVYHRPIKGTLKTATITRTSTGKWYVCFSVECESERLPEQPEQVGIDVGLKTFATLSNAQEIANPRFFRQEERALAKVQRKHSQLAKCSPQRRTHRKAVARVHERIAFRRDNFTHQNSRQIVDRFGVICVEDLHVNRMVHNHCPAKSISASSQTDGRSQMRQHRFCLNKERDAAWSAFFDQLSCKAEEAGRAFVKVNPAYTTQDCSRCHHRQPMPLGERTYRCPCCHLVIGRDQNASLNIRALGLQSIGIQPVEAPAFYAGE
jgi:putative transposase